MSTKKQLYIFSLIFLGLRLFSYFFSSGTALVPSSLVNTAAAAIIFILAVYFLIKRQVWGWYIIALEIILGGSGHYLAIFGTNLRTLLLIASLVIYFTLKIFDCRRPEKNCWQNFNRNELILLSGLFFSVGWAAARGWYFGHDLKLIISEVIPYLFLLYYLPARELWDNINFRKLIFLAITVNIIGNFLLVFYTFFSFSAGINILQNNYYHWYRDVALGKITALPFNFFRITLDEQLLLIPMLVYFLDKIIREEKSKLFVLLSALLLAALAINLTRIYLLALVVGLLFLFAKKSWKRWLVVSGATLIIFFAIFTAIHTLTSRGQSLGWEIFGLRLQSIVTPQIEDSSLSRMLLLPEIGKTFKQHPIFGSGLGTTLTINSPVFKRPITTAAFDWGYLQIATEMGLMGAFFWGALIVYLIHKCLKNRLFQGIFSGFMTLLVINITSPALLHVFGAIWLAITLCFLSQKLIRDR